MLSTALTYPILAGNNVFRSGARTIAERPRTFRRPPPPKKNFAAGFTFPLDETGHFLIQLVNRDSTSSDASETRTGIKETHSLVASEMTCESSSQVQWIERGTSRRCVPSCAASETRTPISKEPFPWQLRRRPRRRPRRSPPRRPPRRSNWPGGRRGKSSLMTSRSERRSFFRTTARKAGSGHQRGVTAAGL